VRHGAPLRREDSIKDGRSEPVVYRPEKFDVLVYDQITGELRMKAETKGEKKLYREQFGKHLFSNPEFFGESGKYTLDPLRVDSEAALNCADVPGMDAVTLTEIHYFWPGNPSETEIRKSKDVFAALAARGRSIRPSAKIIQAVFDVKFSDSKTSRRVRVILPSKLNCGREYDTEVVGDWLAKRRFLADQAEQETEDEGQEVEAVLAST